MIKAISMPTPYKTGFSSGTHKGIADVPAEKGGLGNGFGPHELLEAAFATCLSMTVRMYAAKHAIPLSSASCEVRIDRSNPDAAVLNYALELEGSLTDEQSDRLRTAADKCPVARTLRGAVVLQPTKEGGSS